MAASATRRYNNSAAQIQQAVDHALRYCRYNYGQEGSARFVAQVGMHWPFTSYGERIDIRIAGPGELRIESRYAMPTQVFELGDNLRNCERIIDALEQSLRNLQAACPQCGSEIDRSTTGAFCTLCGFRFHASSLSQPYPKFSGRTYALSFVLSFLIPFVIVGLVFFLAFSQMGPQY